MYSIEGLCCVVMYAIEGPWCCHVQLLVGLYDMLLRDCVVLSCTTVSGYV